MRTGARIALGLLLALALFAALEGGARLLRPPPEEPSTGLEWMEYATELGWRNRPGFRGEVFDAERAFDEDGLFTVDSPAAAPEGRSGRKLVLLLGDSRTFGNGVPVAETYGEVLDRRLRGFEVINLAVPGHSSFQGRAALELHAPRFRPDVVVFAFGFNDRRYVLRPDEADGEDRFRRLARRAAWSRLAGSLALVDLLGGSRPGGPDGAMEHPLDLGTVRPRVPPESFRRNLEAAARYCDEHGIGLVFLLLNDNPVETRDLERGVQALRAGRLAEAGRALRQAVALGNEFSDAARLSLAEVYERTGRSREASTVRISPRTFHSVTGGYPILPEEGYRAATFEVAARYREQGTRAVDAGAVLERHPERYLDFCHFGREGHRAVADLLAAEFGGPPPPPLPRAASSPHPERERGAATQHLSDRPPSPGWGGGRWERGSGGEGLRPAAAKTTSARCLRPAAAPGYADRTARPSPRPSRSPRRTRRRAHRRPGRDGRPARSRPPPVRGSPPASPW